MGSAWFSFTITRSIALPCLAGGDLCLFCLHLSLSLRLLTSRGTLHPVLLVENFMVLQIFNQLPLWLRGGHPFGNDWDQPQVLYPSSCVLCLAQLIGGLLSLLIYHRYFLWFDVARGRQDQSFLEFKLGRGGWSNDRHEVFGSPPLLSWETIHLFLCILPRSVVLSVGLSVSWLVWWSEDLLGPSALRWLALWLNLVRRS